MKNDGLSLQIICKGTKDEIEELANLLRSATGCVDHIYLTVTHPDGKKPVKELTDGYDDVTVSYFKWIDRFDEARNFNYAQSNYRYKMWIDVGDVYDFSQLSKIPYKHYASIWMPYYYAFDKNGNCVAEHWRERITDSLHPFEWKGWIHETLISELPHESHRVNTPVIHKKYDKDASMERNHKILDKAYKATKDPRYIHYLGLSYYTMQKWQEAINIFEEYLKVGGWDEEIYRTLLRMGESYNQLDEEEDAQTYYLKAAGLKPEYPWAYYNLAELEFQNDMFQECLEWLKVAFSKPEPETASIYDPTVPEKAKIMAATCEFMLGDARKSVKILETVRGEAVDDLMVTFQKEADREVLAAVLQELRPHLLEPEKVWNQLPEDFRHDNKYKETKNLYVKPKTWPKNSIVFFCGKGYEEWGPHTLDKGMGGSEEAIVYLTPELVKLGYDVTVYGEVKQPLEHEGVKYLPWRWIDKRDQFDTLIIWRAPAYSLQFKANKMFCDVHDKLPKDMVKNYPGLHYLFKSQYHANLYDVNNYSVISNGIKEQY